MENTKGEKDLPSCCLPQPGKKGEGGLMQGIIYGIVPHTFCILFVVASIIGATAAVTIFKPFLMNRYFFHYLVVLSLVFATISSMFYLRRNGLLSFGGAKRKWKYLSVMYGTTVGINLLLFLVIFPMVANITSPTLTGAAIALDTPALVLDVDIPCPGHAPLIIGELQTIDGILDVKYKSWKFNVLYDDSKTSKQEILALDVFNTYPATIESESAGTTSLTGRVIEEPASAGGCSAGGCGTASCGRGCGGGCGGS